MKLRFLPSALVLATGAFLLTACREEKIMPPQVGQIIRSTVESELLPAAVREHKELTRAWNETRKLYRKRQYLPAWSGPKGPLPEAGQLIAAIHGVAADGLDPRRYRVAALADDIREAKERSDDLDSPEAQRRLADLDVELTYTYLTLAAHEAVGRVKPETLRGQWDAQPRNMALDVRLARALDSKADLLADLRSLAPPNPSYAHLRDALARYRQIADHGGWPTVPEGPAFGKGDHGPRVAALRARLSRTGDLAEPLADPDIQGARPVSDLYDDAVTAAVIHFQKRNGLAPSGKVDADTLAELNVPAERRVRQIELNLERWRWLPGSFGDRYILVNVPEFRMEVRDHGRTVIDMPVVVGKKQSQTPVFSDRMTYLELNPTWNVPPSIAGTEIVPKLAGNPGYLAKHHMELVRGWDDDATAVDPASVDPAELASPSSPYRIRQLSGPSNSLGQIKFMFPNEYDVYLHDTPADSLFAQSERDFSHGCIRLARPLELADYLLRDNPDWQPDRIREAIASGKRQSVKLPASIPVHILYFTAWVEADGTMQFRQDVYGHDRRLDEALSKEPAAPLDLPTLRGEVTAAMPRRRG